MNPLWIALAALAGANLGAFFYVQRRLKAMTPIESLESAKKFIADGVADLQSALQLLPEQITNLVKAAIAKSGGTISDEDVLRFSQEMVELFRPAIAMPGAIDAVIGAASAEIEALDDKSASA